MWKLWTFQGRMKVVDNHMKGLKQDALEKIYKETKEAQEKIRKAKEQKEQEWEEMTAMERLAEEKAGLQETIRNAKETIHNAETRLKGIHEEENTLQREKDLVAEAQKFECTEN